MPFLHSLPGEATLPSALHGRSSREGVGAGQGRARGGPAGAGPALERLAVRRGYYVITGWKGHTARGVLPRVELRQDATGVKPRPRLVKTTRQ